MNTPANNNEHVIAINSSSNSSSVSTNDATKPMDVSGFYYQTMTQNYLFFHSTKNANKDIEFIKDCVYFIDLSTTQSYSLEEADETFGWKWMLTLHLAIHMQSSSNVNTSKVFLYKETDTPFTVELINKLKKMNMNMNMSPEPEEDNENSDAKRQTNNEETQDSTTSSSVTTKSGANANANANTNAKENSNSNSSESSSGSLNNNDLLFSDHLYLMEKIDNCPGKHGLKPFQTPVAGYSCNVCYQILPKMTVLHGCRECDCDICDNCIKCSIAQSNNSNDNALNDDNNNSNSLPYFVVLRDLKLEFFRDYASFQKYEQNTNHNDNDNNNSDIHGPIKSLHILHDIKSCERSLNIHWRLDRYYDNGKYSLIIESKTPQTQNIHLLSLWNNMRLDLYLHILFIQTFKCMPNDMISEQFYQQQNQTFSQFQSSTLDQILNDLLQNETNQSEHEILLLCKRIEQLLQPINNDNNNINNSNDNLEFADKAFLLYMKAEQSYESETIRFPDFGSILRMCSSSSISMASIMEWYASVNANANVGTDTDAAEVDSDQATPRDETRVCEHGNDCLSYCEYTRDRNNDTLRLGIRNNNTQHTENAVSIEAMQNMMHSVKNATINDTMHKIHSFLYTHVREDDNLESNNINIENDNEIENENENAAEELQLPSTNTHNKSRRQEWVGDGNADEDEDENKNKNENENEKTNTNTNGIDSNLNKFIIDCGDSRQTMGKFGFGSYCVYHQCHRNGANFVYPSCISLFEEACFNPVIDHNVNILPMVFWMFYLKSVYFRMVFKTTFSANKLGELNAMYNVLAGSVLCIGHYLSLLLYSDCTEFQCEFKKYARKMNDQETNAVFYKRNSHIAHWCRYLQESVVIFGRVMGRRKKRDIFYCGISVPLLFDSFDQSILSPLSTSTAFTIGLRFAGNHGMLLKMHRTDDKTKYFPLYMFSQFSEEMEHFVYNTELKIFDIGFQSESSGHLVYCRPFIRAILLLEKLLKGQLFIDCNPFLIKAENIQLMMDLIDAYKRNAVIHVNDDENDNNGSNNVPADFLAYNQSLFNNRLKQFIAIECHNPLDQIWLNKYELSRIDDRVKTSTHSNNKSSSNGGRANSSLNMEQFLLDTILVSSANPELNINPVYYCPPTPFSFAVAEQHVGQILNLKINRPAFVTVDYQTVIEKNGMQFTFRISLLRATSNFPDNCALFLRLFDKDASCNSLSVLYDVVCPELKYESLNVWKRFTSAREYSATPIFKNARLLSSSVAKGFTVSVGIRIVVCE